MRASWRRERGLTFVHPFDDPRVIAGPGHGRARDARGRARRSTRWSSPIGGGGLISGMATVAQARRPADRGDRRRGRALSRRCTTASTAPTCRAAATRWPRASRSRSRARSPRAIVARAGRRHRAGQRTRARDSGRLLLQIEKTVVEGAGAAGLAALLAHPERFARQDGRHRPVRRQYRHAAARQRAAARSRALGPARAAAHPAAGSARRAVPRRADLRRAAASTSSRSITSASSRRCRPRA